VTADGSGVGSSGGIGGLTDAEVDELVAAAQAGDSGARDRIVALVAPMVARRCARFLPCREDAEEATQDALLAIAQKIGSFSGRGSFAGWVVVVASNCARSTYRDLKRRSVELATDELPARPDPRTTSVIAGSRIDLLEAIEHLEAHHPALVDAFVLRDLAALPYDDIAAQLGIPLGTVKARIHDARRVVRTRLT